MPRADIWLCLAALTLAAPALAAGLHASQTTLSDTQPAPAPSQIAPLPLPTGPVLLTIKGQISVKNVDDTAQFDIAMLEELGGTSLTTTTPWTAQTQKFEVIALQALLQRVGATGDIIFAEAINDYNTEIPLSDALEHNAMIAYRNFGEEIPIREKGPLWVIYPYESSAQYRTDVYYTRSIWQLDRMTIRDSKAHNRN